MGAHNLITRTRFESNPIVDFELAKALSMSPCIIRILNVLHVNESSYLSLGKFDYMNVVQSLPSHPSSLRADFTPLTRLLP